MFNLNNTKKLIMLGSIISLATSMISMPASWADDSQSQSPVKVSKKARRGKVAVTLGGQVESRHNVGQSQSSTDFSSKQLIPGEDAIFSNGY